MISTLYIIHCGYYGYVKGVSDDGFEYSTRETDAKRFTVSELNTLDDNSYFDFDHPLNETSIIKAGK